MKTTKVTVFIASVYLVFHLVGGLLSSPAEEDSSSVMTLRVLFEIGMIVGLVGWLIGQYKTAMKTGEMPSAGEVVVPAIGVLAALGLLGMQLFGNPEMKLSPRDTAAPSIGSAATPSPSKTVQSSPSPSSSPGKAAPTASFMAFGLRMQFESAVREHDRLNEVAARTRWMQSPGTTPTSPAGISRQDLRDYQDAVRNLVSACDRVLKQLPNSNGVQKPSAGDLRELWQTQRRAYSEVLEQVNLIEENWSEWYPNGFDPKDPNLKPWQKKVLELDQAVLRDGTTAKNLSDRIHAEPEAR